MTTKLKNIVTEADSLDREISKQTERLKTLKAQLVEANREHEDELTPTDGGDKAIMFLAEVLNAPVQELFPPRAGDNQLSDFRAQLERTRF